MSTLRSVIRKVVRPVASSVVGGVGGGAFSPSSLANVREWALDGTPYYDAGSPLSNLPVLRSREPYGTYRAPRQGRCWLFDGTNDIADMSSNLTLNGDFTLFMKCSQTTAINRMLFGTTNPTANWFYHLNATQFEIRNDAAVATTITHGHTFALNETYAIFIIRSGSTVTIYKNTTAASATGTVSGNIRVGRIGGYSSLNLYFAGKMFDIRIYNVAKDATAIAAIYAGDDDTTGLLAHYPCNEEAGTVGYDISGNANHLTLTNITAATFHAADTGVTKNRNNVHGYRLSGSVYIPKRLTTDLAADGNALTATGQSPYPVATESPCVTFNGTNTYLELETIPANKTAFVFSGWIYVNDKGVSSPQILFESSTNYNSNVNAVIAVFDDASGDNTLAFAIRAAVGNLRMRYFNFAAYFGTWVHLAVQIRSDNGAMICSLNGATQVLTNNPTYVSDPTGNLVERKVFIGCRSGGSVAPMNGSIAGLKIDLPTTALTQAELNALFTSSSYVPNFLCLPLQDGPGSSNTNRNLAYYKSDGTYGVISNAIVNGTVANIWANRCPNVEDHSIKYGGRLGAGGEFILGVPDTTLCADGNAKTLSAGKHGNPYSRLNLNPFTAAELNGRSLPTALAPAGSLASVTPADSAFMRSDTDGDDRLIVTDAALTGAELDNMETYIGLVRLVDDDGDFTIDDDTDFLVGA